MRSLVGVGLGVGLAFMACDVRPPPQPAASCPPCECNCKCDEAAATRPADKPSGPVTPTRNNPADPLAGPQPADARAHEVADLVASAARKTNFNDGKGCLADLDRVAQLDPKMDARLAVSRGQCEMLVGLCQQGKERVARWYREENNMHPERAAVVAEQLGSMRCREGDSTDRDRLLRAYYDLSDGAYMNKKTPAECQASIAIARALIPRVKPTGPEDGQISGGAQALFHTGATCLGRAGDCKAAYAHYKEFYPALPSVQDAATREKIVRDSFESSVQHCKPKTP